LKSCTPQARGSTAAALPQPALRPFHPSTSTLNVHSGGNNHCMPPALRASYDHGWRNDAGYLKAAPRKLERRLRVRPGQGFSGADIRSIGSHQREGLPAGSLDSAKCLLRYAIRA
jgi:hypothetical protein